MNGRLAALAPVIRSVRDVAAGLHHEWAEIRLTGGRSPYCTMVALAVALAVGVALVVHVDETWWAAISAFMSTQANAPASVRRGVLRISGTFAGAALAVLLSPVLVGDQVALSLALLVVSTTGMVGLLVSGFGYAWLLGAITADMVLMALLSDPLSALSVAADRSLEVMIGTMAAMVVALLVAPDANPTPTAPAPGWRDLLGERWPVVRHALRAGLGVMLVPLVWQWLELPNLTQTAVTVAAVMAVPGVSNDLATEQQAVIERAVHRILGCLFGGVAGLGCLAVSVQSFLPWLLMLTAGIWIAAHVQTSEPRIGYAGTQAAVVFISTLVQGSGPPTSIWPGVERFAGITGGLLILLMVSVLTAPSRPATASARGQ
jgi:uncharacterized membrane protein YccC